MAREDRRESMNRRALTLLGMTAGLMMWSKAGMAEEQCVADYVLGSRQDIAVDPVRRYDYYRSGKRAPVPSMSIWTCAEGMSLGVYRVDYRGFASLARKEEATLAVEFALGPKGNGQNFKRTVRGATTDEFAFTENIGAGLMKRVGTTADPPAIVE